jgi:hypothetical protein
LGLDGFEGSETNAELLANFGVEGLEPGALATAGRVFGVPVVA